MLECSCCGIEFNNRRALNRHLQQRRKQLARHLDLLDENGAGPAPRDDDDDAGPVHHNGNDAPHGPEIVPHGNDLIDMDVGSDDDIDASQFGDGFPADDDAGGPRWRGIDLAAAIARADEEGPDDDDDFDMDELDGDGLFVPPPDIPVAPAVRQNPPVQIEDWFDDDEEFDIEDFPDDFVFPDDDDDDALNPNEEGDPEYIEPHDQPEADAEDEPDLDNEELWARLLERLGDRAHQEWIDLYDRHIHDADIKTFKFLASRLRTHFSRDAYDDLRTTVFEEAGLPSDYVAWGRLKNLSGLESRAYDCCIDSCCCFVGRFENLDACPFCHKNRYTEAGKPRRVFNYTPLIPQLQGLFQSPQSIENMRHRVQHDEHRAHEPDVISDVFDGNIYRTLRNTRVHQEDEYKYFDNPDDIALGFATDGFTLFKRRRRGTSSAWPLILLNYNLHPKIRTRLENVICVGVIPGPKECKDINSFLAPLVEELLLLADGVETSKVASDVDDFDGAGIMFQLRAFLIIILGDIPAISKVLKLKGHNGITPCRACYIQGTRCQLPNSVVYYVPFTTPGARRLFPPENLVPRTHASFLNDYADLDRAEGRAERARIAQDRGITGRPVFAHLNSIDLSSCAPYELMHLVFENLVPNMIKHWKGSFKSIDQADAEYRIGEDLWRLIGELTVQARRTIPSTFVGTLPNIDNHMGLYTAEAYSFWFLYLAPILLNGRLDQEYYEHFLDMREIVIMCLELEITREQVDELERKIKEWVSEYERLYYRYDHDRLPTCVLTIHALLHIPHYIRQTGPPSATWTFVMERFCGYLLRPALSNRIRPYEYLDNFVRRRAQMQVVSRILDMPGLLRPVRNLRLVAGEWISSHEEIRDAFPEHILGRPHESPFRADDVLKRQMTRYFGLAEAPGRREQELRARIAWDTLERHGRLRMASMGDRIRRVELIQRGMGGRNPIVRDNSFIRYELLPDANANHRNLPDVPVRVVHYGLVVGFFYVEWIRDPATDARKPYLLALVKECNTDGADASLPENPLVTYNRLASPEMIHAGAIHAVVGRVKISGRNIWAIVDRTRGARTQFNDEDGNPDDLD